MGPATILKKAIIKHAVSKAVAWKIIRKEIRQDGKDVRKDREPPGQLRYFADEVQTLPRKEILSLALKQVDLKQG